MAAQPDPSERHDVEDSEDALLQGDRPYVPGTARAALAHRPFRIFFLALFSSSIGTWMQSVALGALAYELTRDARFVAFLEFARLTPLLLLSVVGGALADAFDRRTLLLATQSWMIVMAFVLAWVAIDPTPRPAALLACALALGIGNALNNPVQSTLLPHLVGMRDLPGAVSLQSTQMNLSRVVGPAIGGAILPIVHASGIFVINGLTYLFVIGALFVIPRPPRVEAQESGIRRLSSGFQTAAADPLLRRILLTMTTMSFLCLPFIGLMPVLAAENLDISLRGDATYGLLYAAFGLGATTGAISVGTWLAVRSRELTIRIALGCFSVSLFAFGVNRWLPLAFPLAFAVGASYFTTVTSLNTLLQQHLDERVRGRVMALWIMAFGGVIPFGLLWAGQLAQRTSMTAVTTVGAVVLAALAVTNDLRPLVAAREAAEAA